ncbi:hypothetical protein BDV36DRAFT_275903 [Aspergillus pseudocaelatus]|uniref:Uncharacterized protein n=1 Tax=Aspergillus pseudocaelatus TaxID=1825620 RepID=A0ABQ6W203_9EURO|nr:hypothetical protein BDV36DRAFT_275903 [Aspergillus pseudocaelatus]
MSCMLEPRNDGFTVLANYDPQTITHDPLTTFFSEFELVVRQIWSNPSRKFTNGPERTAGCGIGAA